jgi:hypothetical protein
MGREILESEASNDIDESRQNDVWLYRTWSSKDIIDAPRWRDIWA